MPIRLVLTGPTAVGKTELSLSIAERLDADIICLDSRQVYKGFRIGTAQPTMAERTRARHYLTDFLPATENFSAGAFIKETKSILAKNPKRNFILVGGTGLYLTALMEGLPEIPPVDLSVRDSLSLLADSNGLEYCYEKAMEVDPEATSKLKVADRQRVLRVLEVFEQTGRKLSEWQKERRGGLGKLPIVFCNRNRDELYSRIDSRVVKMFKEGWVDEVKELSKTVPFDAPAWNTLGYPEILQVLRGILSSDECIRIVQQTTRHFAKRQLTWFRHQVESLEISLTENSVDSVLGKCLETASEQ